MVVCSRPWELVLDVLNSQAVSMIDLVVSNLYRDLPIAQTIPISIKKAMQQKQNSRIETYKADKQT